MAQSPGSTQTSGTSPNNRYPRIKPRWDPDLRELWVGAILVKAYTGPAQNAETILAAFQENKWRRLLDDPLPPKPGLCSGDRLTDTIQRLKLRQRTHLLHFRICHRGTAIVWQWAVRAAELRALLAAAERPRLLTASAGRVGTEKPRGIIPTGLA